MKDVQVTHLHMQEDALVWVSEGLKNYLILSNFSWENSFSTSTVL